MALRSVAAGEGGTNLSRVKDFNEVVVLDLIRSSGPLGRPAIAAATGLTLQTVSNIVRRLVTAEVVTDAPVGDREAGRRGRRLRANPDAAYAAGIHLVRDVVAAGVVDLAGTVRGRAERRLGLDASPTRRCGRSRPRWRRRSTRPACPGSDCSAPASACRARSTCAGGPCSTSSRRGRGATSRCATRSPTRSGCA